MIQDTLKTLVSKTRYEHILRVKEEAVALAAFWDEDQSKAEIAALCHDCAKELNPEKCEPLGIPLSAQEIQLYQECPPIWHALVGPTVAAHLFNIQDSSIGQAIKWHTTGTANMARLDQIIFLSDYTEAGRPYPSCPYIKELSYQNLDDATYALTLVSIKKLIKKGVAIHPYTVDCYNYYQKQVSAEQKQAIIKQLSQWQ